MKEEETEEEENTMKKITGVCVKPVYSPNASTAQEVVIVTISFLVDTWQ
jgi:hypothetical protein